MAKTTGKGSRKGSVKGRTQVKNTRLWKGWAHKNPNERNTLPALTIETRDL